MYHCPRIVEANLAKWSNQNAEDVEKETTFALCWHSSNFTKNKIENHTLDQWLNNDKLDQVSCEQTPA